LVTKIQVYAALPRRDPMTFLPTGEWDYTCTVDRGDLVITGYCAGWVEWDEQKVLEEYGLAFRKQANDEYLRRLRFKEKYHTDGHPSAAEAESCFRDFLLDQHLTFHRTPRDPVLRKCEVPGCEKFTQMWGSMSPACHLFYLCEEHHNRVGAELRFPSGSIRRIVSSY
jgi:hypothetical protein